VKDKELLNRVDHLLNQGQSVITNKIPTSSHREVLRKDYVGFISASVSFINLLYGSDHSYYSLFKHQVSNPYVDDIERGISILEAIKYEIENGWLRDIKELVTAEVFSDFLEMSKYLLDENYKDAAAVMIGSVLEEHLRQLCNNHSVDTHVTKGMDTVPKKADLLNADLRKAGVYGPLEQKSVSTWLDLRNSAAHGKYGNYRKEQVDIMYIGVLDLVMRVK
jgi:hypothetical protein